MAKWKRYPNRSGATRFNAYFVDVDVVEREVRQVPKVQSNGEGGYDRIVVAEEWAKVRLNGRLRWVPARDLT